MARFDDTAKQLHPLDQHTDILHGVDELLKVKHEWNELAERSGSFYLTVEWLSAWSRAFSSRPIGIVIRDGSGEAVAAACWQKRFGNRFDAAANADHSGQWDIAVKDPAFRVAAWNAIGDLGTNCVTVRQLPDGASMRTAVSSLERSGFVVDRLGQADTPVLRLPSTWEDLLNSVSRNLRQQCQRKRRALERIGSLNLRTIRGGAELPGALTDFFNLEASGWKGRNQTAILSNAQTTQFYRDIAYAAAEAGWLRLHVLELDGVTRAGELELAFAGSHYNLKTAFDEELSHASPGLVRMAESMREAIAEGASFFKFGGMPEAYKMRWGPELSSRVNLVAYRGPWRMARTVARSWRHLKPKLIELRERLTQEDQS